MKIIDLINKISAGEEVPTTIKYQDNYYNLIRKYNEDWEEYEFGYKTLDGGYLNIWRDNILNDEVEIIEDKQIKYYEGLIENDSFQYVTTETYNKAQHLIQEKINEIINYLNKGGDVRDNK